MINRRQISLQFKQVNRHNLQVHSLRNQFFQNQSFTIQFYYVTCSLLFVPTKSIRLRTFTEFVLALNMVLQYTDDDALIIVTSSCILLDCKRHQSTIAENFSIGESDIYEYLIYSSIHSFISPMVHID